MRDLFKALRTMALETTTINGLVGDRIFVNAIDEETIEAADTRQPPKMLVLRMGGGGAKADIMPVVDTNIIALSYGETDFEADAVRRAVEQRFTLLAREIHDSVLIHHINRTGGPIPSVEPDLVWPVIAQTFTVMADILEIPNA